MAKKRHFSARGKEINFDELFIKNQKVTAVTGGGAAMNARGDRLGAGGKIVETVEERQKRSDPQQAQADTPYNTSNPKAVKMVSLKKNIDDLTASAKEEDDFKQAKTPQQVMKELSGKLETMKASKATKAKIESVEESSDVIDELADEVKEAAKSSTRKIVDTDE